MRIYIKSTDALTIVARLLSWCLSIIFLKIPQTDAQIMIAPTYSESLCVNDDVCVASEVRV